MSGRSRPRALQVLVAAGALLLFGVEPMVANALLPRFGGSAAVWQVCLAFFQAALVGGHAASAWLGRRSPRQRAWLLLPLLLAALPLLPGLPPPVPPSDGPPAWQLLALLLRHVALPFVALGLTSNLAQRWAVEAGDAALAGRLVALSNLGSLLGLLAYPLLLEPAVGLQGQGELFTAAFVLWAALLLGLAFTAPEVDDGIAEQPPASASQGGARAGPVPFLAALLTSGLLSVVTAHITRDLAPVPLLWVLPLALYLVSWIAAFARSGGEALRLPARLGLLAFGLVLLCIGRLSFREVLPALGLLLAGLLATALALHAELAARAPADGARAGWFAVVSLGGAVGTGAVAFLAPWLGVGTREFDLLLGGAALLGLVVGRGERGLFRAGLTVALVLALFGGQEVVLRPGSRELARRRTFHGELRVQELAAERVRLLFHGWVLHGAERLPAADPSGAEPPPEPLTYYLREAGLGRAVEALQARGPLHAVGIGLGVGSMAALLRPGDALTFIELEPEVAELARTQFHFLSRSRGQVELRIGDGRQALDLLPAQGVELVAVDAFSGDAVPAHLLTVEAMRGYARLLRPGGLLAFHVSNRSLALAAVVERGAQALGWEARRLVFTPPPGADALQSPSQWVVVGGPGAPLDDPRFAPLLRPFEPNPLATPWSDDHHPLWPLLRGYGRGHE